MAVSNTQRPHDFFYEVYQRCRLQPDQEALSHDQADYLLIIDQLALWNTRFVDIFKQEVVFHRFLSFDCEYRVSVAPRHPPLKRTWHMDSQRLIMIQLGTLSGRVLIFDVECILNGPADIENPLTFLPAAVKGWLRSDYIYKVGSNIAGDQARLGVQINNTVDTMLVYQHYSTTGGRHNAPLIPQSEGYARSGLGAQAYFSRGVDYKPMREADYNRLYGTHRYKNHRGIKSWPSWRSPMTMYQWCRDRNGHFSPSAIFYATNDASTPAAFFAALFLEFELVHGDPIATTTRQTVRIFAGIATQRNPRYEIQPAQDNYEAVAPIKTAPTGRGNPKGSQTTGTGKQQTKTTRFHRQKAGQTTGGAPPPSNDPPSDSSSETQSSSSSSDTSERDSTSQEEEENTQRSKRSRVRQAVRPLRGSRYPRWNSELDRDNPYIYRPVFGRRCTFCGAGGHSRYDVHGEILCPREIDAVPFEEHCQYPICRNRDAHRTNVCPTLHNICRTCFHRGHSSRQSCQQWTADQFIEARDTFEQYATAGFWTARRRHDERWGWWPARRQTPFPYPLPYGDYLRMPVHRADALLRPQRRRTLVNAPPPPVAIGDLHYEAGGTHSGRNRSPGQTREMQVVTQVTQRLERTRRRRRERR